MTQRRDMTQEIYRLLPAVHQIRDAGQQHSLKHLLTVISEQVQLVHDDIDQLYDNWFIETCEDWVVPYIADLVGVTSAGTVASVSDPQAVRFAFPRREIANTVRRRRRKGTLSVLEDLAFDIAGWKARAVNFTERIICTPLDVSFPEGTCSRSGSQLKTPTCENQPCEGAATASHPDTPPQKEPTTTENFFGHTPDFRQPDSERRSGTPFDKGFYTPHFGELQPYVPQTWYGIGKLGLFVWRREIVPVTRGCLHNGYINPLGQPMPLYVKPDDEEDVYGIAEERHLPVRLTAELLCDRNGNPKEQFYGRGRSLYLEWIDDNGKPVPVKGTDIQVVGPFCLAQSSVTSGQAWDPPGPSGHGSPNSTSSVTSGQAARPQPTVRIDPESGWLETDANYLNRLRVTCHHAIPGRIGGGEYHRSNCGGVSGIQRISVNASGSKARQIDVAQRLQGLTLLSPNNELTKSVAIEFDSSETWSVAAVKPSKEITVPPGKTLELRARTGHRPVVEFSEDLTIKLQVGARLVVDGLIFSQHRLTIEVVEPQQSGRPNCRCGNEETSNPDSAEMLFTHSTLELNIKNESPRTKPFNGCISHSIVRGLDATTDGNNVPMYGAVRIHDSVVDCEIDAACELTADRSTFLKPVETERLASANDSIFAGGLRVKQNQSGFLRYCYVKDDASASKTPVRFRCVADVYQMGQESAVSAESLFYDRNYGQPGFAQLRISASDRIRRGAESESEMGAFHNQFTPQLEARLEQQLKEFTPAEMTSRVIYVEELEERVQSQ